MSFRTQRWLTACILAWSAVSFLPIMAQGQTVAKCAAKKTEAAGDHLKAILVCQAKARNPRFNGQKCLQRANDNLVDAFATAEKKGGCVTTGDDDAVLVLNGATFDDVVNRLPYSDECAAAKLKASGRYAGAVLTCTARAVKAGTTASSDCLDRAAATMASAFARADSTGECANMGDLDIILSTLDDGVDEVVDNLPPVPATPTATATASATFTSTLPPTSTPVPPTRTPTSIAPTYTPATPSGTCGGTSYGGYCWYLGGNGQSCDAVCASRSGTCNLNGTHGYAGGGGTAANCNAVLDAMNFGTVPNASTMSEGYAGYGGGCTVNYSVNGRIHWNGTTTCDAHDSINAPVCACDVGSGPTHTATPMPTSTPTPVPPTVPPGGCSGAQVAGYCWYLGNGGQSCDAVCAARGGTCNLDGTHGYAGGGGSAANCNAVLDALHLATIPATSMIEGGDSAAGCVADHELFRRVHFSGSTSCASSDAILGRTCACDMP